MAPLRLGLPDPRTSPSMDPETPTGTTAVSAPPRRIPAVAPGEGRGPWVLGGWLLLVLAAAIVGLRDLRRPFDRGFDGHQGAFWIQAAINFDRLGPGATHGVPIVNVDLPRDAEGAPRLDGSGWYPYPNHPPTTALLAWCAWRAGGGFEAGHPGAPGARVHSSEPPTQAPHLRGPRGFEGALRFPFFLAHLVALFAFAFLTFELAGASRSLCALAVFATAPGVLLFGDLVNVENPALAMLLLGLGFGARATRTGRRSHFVGCAITLALAGCITWAPLAFLPPFVVTLTRRHGRSAGARFAAVAGISLLLPLLAWSLHVERTLAAAGLAHQGIGLRIKTLLGPLLQGDGVLIPWLLRQGSFGLHALGPIALALAVLGIGLPLLPRLLAARRGVETPAPPGTRPMSTADGALALLLGGLLANLAFFRHSAEAQESFQLWLAPGLCALAARVLAAPTRALLRLGAGIGPQVLLVGTVAIFGLADFEVQAHRLRSPIANNGGDGGGSRGGLRLPAPELALPSVLGPAIAEVLPPRAIGWLPAELGTNPAVGLYAWRSLLPARGPDDPVALGQATSFAPDPRTQVWVILPTKAPTSAAAAVADWEKVILDRGLRLEDAAVSKDGSWRAWPWTEVVAPGRRR